MRRNEFEITDRAKIDSFLSSCITGILTLSSDEGPYSVPMNFGWNGEMILMHSSLDGKKAPLLRAGRPGQFTVYREYSVIPSFFSQSREACNATQFFASVMLFGATGEITDLRDKAAALNSIMDQVQGKGTYPSITADNPKSGPMLKEVGIFCLRVTSITTKFKAGQNLSDERADRIIESLLNRGNPLDIETAEFMRKMRPAQI